MTSGGRAVLPISCSRAPPCKHHSTQPAPSTPAKTMELFLDQSALVPRRLPGFIPRSLQTPVKSKQRKRRGASRSMLLLLCLPLLPSPAPAQANSSYHAFSSLVIPLSLSLFCKREIFQELQSHTSAHT